MTDLCQNGTVVCHNDAMRIGAFLFIPYLHGEFRGEEGDWIVEYVRQVGLLPERMTYFYDFELTRIIEICEKTTQIFPKT